jgi:hypothetical protein
MGDSDLLQDMVTPMMRMITRKIKRIETFIEYVLVINIYLRLFYLICTKIHLHCIPQNIFNLIFKKLNRLYI